MVWNEGSPHSIQKPPSLLQAPQTTRTHGRTSPWAAWAPILGDGAEVGEGNTLPMPGDVLWEAGAEGALLSFWVELKG